MKEYIFTSARLGFRNWKESDLPGMLEINSDKEVMEFFPQRPSKKETWEFIQRMQNIYTLKGFCYFAVEKLEEQEFIGFIGLAEQDFVSDFTPCTDIGWRLRKSVWHKGYATEGANACLDFAFQQLQMQKVYAIAPVVNTRSESVMKKIGMQKVKIFEHPGLLDQERLKNCVLYEKVKNIHPGPLNTLPDEY